MLGYCEWLDYHCCVQGRQTQCLEEHACKLHVLQSRSRMPPVEDREELIKIIKKKGGGGEK